MGSSIKIVEIVSSLIAFLSLFTNITAIYLVLSIRKESRTVIGLDLILLLAGYDLIAPTMGILQEVISLSLGKNILTNFATCQILGALETLVPFISSGAVALLSLERYLYICNSKLATKSLLAIGLVHLSLGLILSVLASSSGSYSLVPSRMICSVTPTGNTQGRIWFYVLLVFFILHSLIIIFSYCKIISIRTRIYDINSLTTYKESDSETVSVISLKLAGCPRKPTSPINSERKSLNQIYPSRFVIKTFVLLAAYLLCIIPGAGVMLYEAVKYNAFGNDEPLSPMLSALMFVPLFTLSLVNPILVLSLHNAVSIKFRHKLVAFAGLFRRKH